jgi:acyl carrier protein
MRVSKSALNIDTKAEVETDRLVECLGQYADDTSFLRDGIIDSPGVVELVESLRKHFQLNIEQQEVRLDKFGSVARLAAYVTGKSGVVAA